MYPSGAGALAWQQRESKVYLLRIRLIPGFQCGENFFRRKPAGFSAALRWRRGDGETQAANSEIVKTDDRYVVRHPDAALAAFSALRREPDCRRCRISLREHCRIRAPWRRVPIPVQPELCRGFWAMISEPGMSASCMAL